MNYCVSVKYEAPIKKAFDYLLLFYLTSLFGWVWELLVYLFLNRDASVSYLIRHYRGVLHGPWVPIYGVGCLCLAFLWSIMKERKIRLLLYSAVSCAVIEYTTACILEQLFHTRWWDYSDFFLNFDGKICFLSIFVFGVLGTTATLHLMPLYQRFMQRCSTTLKATASFILSALFLTDTLYSLAGLLQRTGSL